MSESSVPGGAPKSVGFRGFSSRLIAPDRASRILGHRYEENYLHQAIGQCFLSWKDAAPAKLAIFASEPEMDVISRSGVCGTLATAFGGSLELHELSEPLVRDLVKMHLDGSSTASRDPLIVVLLGAEKKPKAWPLPDFGKVLPAEPIDKSGRLARAGYSPGFGRSGEWLRLGRKGGMSFLDHAVLATAWQDPVSRNQGAFEYSWGIWAATLRSNGLIGQDPSQASTRRVRIESVNIESSGAGLLAFSGVTREKLASFLAGFDRGRGGCLAVSFPTPEACRWLFQAAGFSPAETAAISFTEESHGWGPAFTFLRFVSDCPAGSRLILMRDLSSVDLVEIE
jgi:hypothetical protein